MKKVAETSNFKVVGSNPAGITYCPAETGIWHIAVGVDYDRHMTAILTKTKSTAFRGGAEPGAGTIVSWLRIFTSSCVTLSMRLARARIRIGR